MRTETMRIRNDGAVQRVGIETGAMTLLGVRWSDAGLILSVRTEGGHYWAGRGQQGYSGTEVETFLAPEVRDLPDEGTITLRVVHLISTPLRTKAQQETAHVTVQALRKRLQREAMESAHVSTLDRDSQGLVQAAVDRAEADRNRAHTTGRH
jgi:hypothetical protein